MPVITRRTVLIGGAATTISLVHQGAYAATRELEVLYTDPQLLTQLHEQIAAKFIEKNPSVKINLRVVQNYDEALAQVLRDGLTGTLPHIAFHGLNNIGLLSRRGLLTPLDKFISREGGWDQLGYASAVNNLGKSDGQTWGVPLALSVLICMYNKQFVKEAGGDPSAFPSTWEGIISLGKSIKASSGGIYFRYESTGNVFLFSLLRSFGAKILSDDLKTIHFNSPESLSALKVLREIGEARGGADLSGSAARQAFAAGTLGILIDSSSGLANYEKQAAGRFEIGTAAIPFPGGDNARMPAAGNAGVIHTKDDQTAELAWEYLKFAANAENQMSLVASTAYVPVNTNAVAELEDWYRKNPSYRTAVSLLPRLVGWEAFPGENSLKIDKALSDEAQKILTLKASPEDALRAMYRAASDMMPKS